ncbi:acyl-CoA synthetase-like protein [Dinothrombium tinctorium]|uniref:Acyl-CoA synthetase-like protein n=1 Tax=Dinothrombium tinctorium TaxID=1965070 RepID=A0A3S3NQL8_9ACAR|nr:acyl-CoA synthetase-like protein [Dinothrombium tinctorium]RWS07371.1 acyl-CoA synthetase-like protein [Dinothrombium tinctorium]
MEAKSLESHVMYPYSYAYGKSSKTLLYESLARCLEKVAAKHNKIAVISEHENVMKTFQELNADANRLAKVMAQKLHIKLGDVVAVMTANCYNFVVIQYACAKIGAILCPINAYYTSQELEMCLKKVNPKLFFIPSKGSDQELSVNKIYDVFVDIKTELPSKLSHVIFLDGNGSSCGPLKNCASHYFSDLVYGEDKICADELNNNVFVDIDADEVCSFFFTSAP